MRLEKSYRLYQVRLMLSYLGVFFIVHTFITLLVCLVIFTLPVVRWQDTLLKDDDYI